MTPEQWKRRSIYQVLTDRFAPTYAADESKSCDYTKRCYCGGTWQGIIRRLDYIQSMGFDAIWISPITKQIEDVTYYGEAYHGYWQEDIFELNPHFGTESDLLALSNALHTRGMALMVDVVVNHFGSSSTVDYSRYTPFNNGSYFHSEKFIADYNNQQNVEQGWLGTGQVPLPDVNTENPVVVSTFEKWISNLIQTYHIDGLRLDTVKHVRKDFWPGFIESAGVFALGEVLSGDPVYLSSYQPYTGGLLDYGTYYPLLRAFAGGNMGELVNLISSKYRKQFQDTQLLGTFMENHDNPRFASTTSKDFAIIQSAITYVMLSDGIPIIYYGQEQGFDGADDPQNRENLWSSGYKQNAMTKYIALLNKARKASWDNGFGTNLTTCLYSDTTTLITQKGPVLLALSNQGSKLPVKAVTINPQYAPGTVLVDIMTCSSILIKTSSTLYITAGCPRVYLPLAIASQFCSNIIAPVSSTSLITRLTSIFTSSSKTSARTAARNTLTTYNAGTTAKLTTSLTSVRSLLTTAAPLVPPVRVRLVVATTNPIPTTTKMSYNDSPNQGRPMVPTAKPNKRAMYESPQHSPRLPASANAQPQRRQNTRNVTVPPASLSQHYREERVSPRPSASNHALSSKYSYSSSHLPLRPDALENQHRSVSDSSLRERQHGHSQSQSMHNIRRKTSAGSLSMPGSRSNSFTSNRPPVPPVPSMSEARSALLDANAPYAHTFSLSSTSLLTPHQPYSPHASRSRRSSITSNRSAYDDPAMRKRNASFERQALLAQENNPLGTDLVPRREVMANPAYGRSQTSIHSQNGPTRARAVSSGSLGLDRMSRRTEQRSQMQQEIRAYRP